MPARPAENLSDGPARARGESQTELLAVALREELSRGAHAIGSDFLSGTEVATRFGVSARTATRALKLLGDVGVLDVRNGHRSVVIAIPVPQRKPSPHGSQAGSDDLGTELLDLAIRCGGNIVKRITAEASLHNGRQLRELLAARSDG